MSKLTDWLDDQVDREPERFVLFYWLAFCLIILLFVGAGNLIDAL